MKRLFLLAALLCGGLSTPAWAQNIGPSTTIGPIATDLQQRNWGSTPSSDNEWLTACGYNTCGDGGEGLFHREACTADGGWCIADSAGNTFKRQNFDGSLAQYGITAGSVYDATTCQADRSLCQGARAKVLAAISAAQAAGLSEVDAHGVSFIIDNGDLIVPAGIKLDCGGTIPDGVLQSGTGANPYTAQGGFIWINPLYRVAPVSIKHCNIGPTWFTTTLIASITSTRTLIDNYDHAKTGTGLYLTGKGVDAENVFVFGFDTCIEVTGSPGALLRNPHSDCNINLYDHDENGGLTVDNPWNVAYVEAGFKPSDSSVKQAQYAITGLVNDGTGKPKITYSVPGTDQLAVGDRVFLTGLNNRSNLNLTGDIANGTNQILNITLSSTSSVIPQIGESVTDLDNGSCLTGVTVTNVDYGAPADEEDATTITVTLSGNSSCTATAANIRFAAASTAPPGLNGYFTIASKPASGQAVLAASWAGPTDTASSWVAGANSIKVGNVANIGVGQYVCASGTAPSCTPPTGFATVPQVIGIDEAHKAVIVDVKPTASASGQTVQFANDTTVSGSVLGQVTLPVIYHSWTANADAGQGPAGQGAACTPTASPWLGNCAPAAILIKRAVGTAINTSHEHGWSQCVRLDSGHGTDGNSVICDASGITGLYDQNADCIYVTGNGEKIGFSNGKCAGYAAIINAPAADPANGMAVSNMNLRTTNNGIAFSNSGVLTFSSVHGNFASGIAYLDSTQTEFSAGATLLPTTTFAYNDPAVKTTTFCSDGSNNFGDTFCSTTLQNVTPTGGDTVASLADIAARFAPVDSIAALHAATGLTGYQRVHVSGYYGQGTPGGGQFAYDGTSCTDNGGTEIKDGAGIPNCWKRVAPTNSVYEWGAYGDATTVSAAMSYSAGSSNFTVSNTSFSNWATAMLAANRRPYVVIYGAGASGYPLATYITGKSGTTYTMHDAAATAPAVWASKVTTINAANADWTLGNTATFADGTVIKAVLVTGGVPQAFRITTAGSDTSTPSQPMTPTSTSGGTGLTVTITYKSANQFAYGSDDQTAVANAMAYAVATGIPVVFPAGKMFGIAAPPVVLPTTGTPAIAGGGRWDAGLMALGSGAQLLYSSTGSANVRGLLLDGNKLVTDTFRWESTLNQYHFDEIDAINGTSSEAYCSGTPYIERMAGGTDSSRFPNPALRATYGFKGVHGCDDGSIDTLTFKNDATPVYTSSNTPIRQINAFGSDVFRPLHCLDLEPAGANPTGKRYAFVQCGNASGAAVYLNDSGVVIDGVFVQSHTPDDPTATDTMTTNIGVEIATGVSNSTISGCNSQLNGGAIGQLVAPSNWILQDGTAGTGNIFACGGSVKLPGVQVGAPTGGDEGTGTVNATGFYENGSRLPRNGVSLTGLLALDGTTDDSAALNTILLASSSANTCFVLPSGKTLAISAAAIRFRQAGECFIFNNGAKVKLLNSAAAITKMMSIEANNVAILAPDGWYGEIDGNSANNTNAIVGIRATGSVTGAFVRNIYVHNTTGKCFTWQDAPEVTMRHWKADHCSDLPGSSAYGTVMLATNIADTGNARLDIQDGYVDRTANDPTNANLSAAVNIVGTATHPTYGHFCHFTDRDPINPVAVYGVIGVRNAVMEYCDIEGFDGSLGLSFSAPSTWPALVNGFRWTGGNQWAIEIPGGSDPAQHSIAVTNFVLDGKGTDGVIREPTPISIGIDDSGAVTCSGSISLTNGVIKNFTDEGIKVEGCRKDVDITDVDIDASSVTGAFFGDTAGIVLRNPTAGQQGPQRVNLRVKVHGGGVATRALLMRNVTGVYGSLDADGINGPTVEAQAYGTFTTDHVNLTVNSGPSNASSNQLTLTTSGGGSPAFGADINIGGPNFIPYAAGFFGSFIDANAGRINVYDPTSTTPESVENGSVGSIVRMANGSVYEKTTALGTLTGWVQIQDSSGHCFSAGTQCAASATTDTTSASNISSGTLAAARGGAGTVSGALKGNGSGVVSQAACGDLSDGGTACSKATGTSGATVPLLNGTNTWSAAQTLSVAPVFGDAAGTRTALGVPATGTLLAVTVFTGSGTWTPNAATKSAIVDTWGGGGCGGGAVASASNTAAAGGGAGGSFNRSLLTGAAIAAQTITIPAACTVGDATGSSGTGGGTVTLGSLVSCPGGGGGTGNPTPTTSPALTAAGTAGSVCTASGTGLTSLLNFPGMNGSPGISYSGTVAQGGGGGMTTGGQGRTGPITASGGSAGVVFGNGGGGGMSNGATGKTGGAGATGVEIIYEYE